MRQKLLKQSVSFWFRAGLIVLTILGIVFAGFEVQQKPGKRTALSRALLRQANILLGRFKRSDDIDWTVIDCTNLSNEAIAKKWNNANLQRVKLKGATVDDRFFINLRQHEELRKILFEDCNLTSNGLSGLSQFFDLLFLEFNNCRLEENCLGAIKNMRSLFQISVTDCSLTDQHLQDLHGSRIPVSITLMEDEITTGGILALRQANPSWKIELPSQQPVDRSTVRTSDLVNVIPSIDEISNIEELTFSGMLFSDVTMSIVKDASNLKYLSLVNCSFTDDGLKSLQGLENLERLHLSSVSISGPGLQYFPSNIKELYWYSETNIAWKHLDRLVKLESLEIYETHVSEDDLRAVQELKQLKSLTITSKNSQWDGLQHLPTSLIGLGAFYGVTNDAVKQLGRLNNLEILALGGKLISDEACNDLANMKSLQYVELHDTAITEAGLEILTKAFGEQSNHRNQIDSTIQLQRK